MMNWYLGNNSYLLLLLLLPLIGYFLVHYIRWKQKKRNVFAEESFQSNLFEKVGFFTKLFPVLYFVAFLFLIFAMIDLLGGKQEIKSEQKMSNVIFLLDVSNSMNAQDVQPSRLEEAKNIITNSLQKMANDRVGIVVFGGDAYSVMPLTTDYSAAQNYISGIETNVMPTQGTDFLKGMQMAVKKFASIPKGARKVVLISDGEDNEGNEGAAINLAKKEGISVITIGIGSDEGAPVPEYYYGQLMGYKLDRNGETVVTKLQNKSLKSIANATGGAYLLGNDLDEAVKGVLSNIKNNSSSSSLIVSSQSSEHYYQYFLAVSVIFFLMIYLFNPKRDFNI